MRNRNWFWGIFFILAAVFVIASQTGSFVEIGFATLLATVLLAALLIHSLIDREFFGIFIALAFLYMIYQQPLFLPEISGWLLVLAAIFISIGLSCIFRSPKEKKFCKRGEGDRFCQTDESLDGNNPYVNVRLGSSIKYLHADSLQGGQFTLSLGSLEVYFDQAALSPQGAEIFIDCRMGEIKLYIPRSWRVKDNIRAHMGNIENDTRAASPAEDAPQLTLSGSVRMGNVVIRYI